MIVRAILASVMAIFSPFVSLFFIINISSDFVYKKAYDLYVFFTVFAVCIGAMYLGKLINFHTLTDSIFGVAVVGLSFHFFFRTGFSYERALLLCFLLNIGYGLIRVTLFSGPLQKELELVFQQNSNFLQQNFSGDKEQLTLLQNSFTSLKAFILQHQFALWAIFMELSAYLGALWFSKKFFLKWNHQLIRWNNNIIWYFVMGLVLYLYPQTKSTGLDLVLIVSVLFLLQGFAIVDFFLGRFLRQSKWMMFFFVIFLILNYFALLIIVLVGLLDFWVNFRKLSIMEVKNNESDSN